MGWESQTLSFSLPLGTRPFPVSRLLVLEGGGLLILLLELKMGQVKEFRGWDMCIYQTIFGCKM